MGSSGGESIAEANVCRTKRVGDVESPLATYPAPNEEKRGQPGMTVPRKRVDKKACARLSR